ncbi:ammonium transporter Rh type B-B-like [Panulirus ornatus]|uniref:ammonium transporter Rh type B-B-like n=1 Tax=Panulirus ornatus TaxID=150431 RepID=UPI003A867125
MMGQLVRRVGWFVVYATLLQIVVMLLFMGYVRYDTFYEGSKWNHTRHHGHSTPSLSAYYTMFQDVQVMLLVGFGFLMTFLRRYGHSALGLNFLLTALALQLGLLVDGLFKAKGGFITLNILSLLEADFTCAAVLISLGAVLGNTSPTQLLLMVLLEVPVYHLNLLIGARLLGAVDRGGSIFVHIFGAYFGVGFSRMVSRRVNVKDHLQEASTYTSDMFSMLGTLFLWAYWPSFNSVVESEPGQGRAVINTYLALVGSTIAAFIASSWIHRDNKWTMVHVQNATLAGGVGVGAVAGLMIHPWGALALGASAGLISTLGYTHLQGWLLERTGLHDTCGVHNLHGLPGILSALVSVGAALFASETTYGRGLYLQYPLMAPSGNWSATLELAEEVSAGGEDRTAGQQALSQALATLITLLLSLVAGTTAGFLLTFTTFNPLTRSQLYNDASWWDLPDEEHLIEAKEEAPHREVSQLFSVQVGHREPGNHLPHVKDGM